MAGKSEAIFQQIYNAVNKKRGEQGGGALPDGSLRMILKKDDLVGYNVHVSFWTLGKTMSEDLYGGGSYQIPWPIK